MQKGLSKAEQESIALYNKADPLAEHYTYSAREQRHFEKRLGLRPVDVNEYNGRTYRYDKSWNRLPLPPRQVSTEQREKLAVRLAEARKRKKIAAILNAC
jgi:predicted transcriptional regulator